MLRCMITLKRRKIEPNSLLGNLIDLFPIYVGMILSTLSLNLHGFVFRLFPQMTSYKLDIILAYILISHLIPNRCGIL